MKAAVRRQVKRWSESEGEALLLVLGLFPLFRCDLVLDWVPRPLDFPVNHRVTTELLFSLPDGCKVHGSTTLYNFLNIVLLTILECFRQVSTTTPPSNEPEPTPMAELDSAAVESMIADNGLNEVTLKVS